MEVSAFSGYINGNSYDDQPGRRSYYTCMSGVSFDIWIRTTGRHIYFTPVIGTRYGAAYTGWFLPNATQSQYQYPAFVGGSTDDADQLVSGTEDDHTCFWRAYSDEYSSAVNDGTGWIEINRFIPLNYGSFETWGTDLDGNRTLYPCEMLQESSSRIFGRVEGVYYVTNSAGDLAAGDVLNHGTKGYVVFNDVYRIAAADVIAIDLLGDE